MKCLLVEDNERLNESLTAILKLAGWEVDSIYDGLTAVELVQADSSYDCMVLDVLLPGRNGLEVATQLRSEGYKIPILILTALGDGSDKIAGLDAGADDYLTKPFNPQELLARLRALVRRSGQSGASGLFAYGVKKEVQFGDTILATDSNDLSCGSAKIHLSKTESALCRALLESAAKTVNKDRLVEMVWGFKNTSSSNNIEVYISFLRKKLRFIKSDLEIICVRQAGYKIDKIVK